MTTPLTAQVRLSLNVDPTREYRLPGAGSRSMLFVFAGKQIGAEAHSSTGDFVQSSRHEAVTLIFWDEAARQIVAPGSAFDVWYGDTIGHGQVDSVGWVTER